jgi:hypothetical protein
MMQTKEVRPHLRALITRSRRKQLLQVHFPLFTKLQQRSKFETAQSKSSVGFYTLESTTGWYKVCQHDQNEY